MLLLCRHLPKLENHEASVWRTTSMSWQSVVLHSTTELTPLNYIGPPSSVQEFATSPRVMKRVALPRNMDTSLHPDVQNALHGLSRTNTHASGNVEIAPYSRDEATDAQIACLRPFRCYHSFSETGMLPPLNSISYQVCKHTLPIPWRSNILIAFTTKLPFLRPVCSR